MRRTPQYYKRQSVKEVFDKILKDEKVVLAPLSISAAESLENDFTITDFSFIERIAKEERNIVVSNARGKGFVDGMFLGLHNHYCEEYPSLEEIRLSHFVVNPLIASESERGTESKLSVLFRVEVRRHGAAEFLHKSRSVLYSCFACALEAFQFYINCERAFNKAQVIIQDAKERNRSDIVQKCLLDLSKITEANTYAQKKER